VEWVRKLAIATETILDHVKKRHLRAVSEETIHVNRKRY
jgi:hypothetical protein